MQMFNMTLDTAYDILERYCITLYSPFAEGNYIDFDVSDMYTKQKLETILSKRYQLDSDDIAFLNELLSDGDLGETVEEAVSFILGENE